MLETLIIIIIIIIIQYMDGENLIPKEQKECRSGTKVRKTSC
jgi:hypothetical protein